VLIKQFQENNLSKRLACGNFKLKVGPFSIRITSTIPSLTHHLKELYSEFQDHSGQNFSDYNLEICKPAGLRKWIRPQVNFIFNESQPFMPLPLTQASPMLEWGLNWVIANHAHQYLIFHAAGLSKNNTMVIMPAPPGSGKSTLTAALMQEGWRLFSDELVLIDLKSGKAQAISRPINLKNNSIDVLTTRYPKAYMSNKCHDTHKGTVALMKPTDISVNNVDTQLSPTHIIYPKYEQNSSTIVQPLDKSDAFMELITNSFNYHILYEQGFDAATQLVKNCDAHKLTYSNLDEAITYFNGFAAPKDRELK